MAALRQQASGLYEKVRGWASGPTSSIVLGTLVLVAAVLVAVHYSGGRSVGSPHKHSLRPGSTLRVVWGRVYPQQGKRRRVRHLRPGHLYQTVSRHCVVAFGDNSTFRPTRFSRFNWSLLEDGHYAFQLEMGGAWFQLGPMDYVMVEVPSANVRLKLGCVAEIHVNKSNRTRIYLRSGEATVIVTRKLAKPIINNKSGSKDIVRYRMLTYPLKTGHNLLVGVYRDLTPKVKPDNDWEKWNLKWKTLSDLHALPHPPPQKHKRKRRS